MSWATTADLVNATGSALDTATLQAIIDSAEREINAALSPLNITGSDALREASLHLSIARLYTRYDLVGQLTQPTINGSTASHEAQAWKLVDAFISAQNRTRSVKRWVQI
jgi:hypothetical protein